MEEDFLSVDNFRKWMKKNSTENTFNKNISEELFGTLVKSKVNTNKLLNSMQINEGELEELAIDFKRDGGSIKKVIGKTFLIEVASGSFYILRHYVTRV